MIKNDISSEKLPIEENDTILSTTENKNCVNDNCFSTIPILSTTAKASGKLISLSKSVNKVGFNRNVEYHTARKLSSLILLFHNLYWFKDKDIHWRMDNWSWWNNDQGHGGLFWRKLEATCDNMSFKKVYYKPQHFYEWTYITLTLSTMVVLIRIFVWSGPR